MKLTDILSRLSNVKGSGKQRTARCPAHSDSTNSLSLTSGDDGRVLLQCHAGCSVDAICGALGLDVKDLFPEREAKPKPVKPAKPLTLAELADAKRLPIEWLREQGVDDWPDGSGVAIGYFDESAVQVSRVRKRTALRAKDGSFWTGEGALIPYGVWRLREWRQ